MSDHERGAYTPQPDAPLSFDPRTSREGRPLPLALIASCIVLATLVVALFMFYQSGMRRGSEPPAAVGTPVDQFRSPPPPNNGQAPEGMTVVAATPPAEAPLPTAPGVSEKPVERGATAPVAAPPAPPPPTVAARAPAPAPPVQRAAAEPPPPPPAMKPAAIAKTEPPVRTAPVKAVPSKAAADPVGALLDTSKAAKPVKTASAKPVKPAAEPLSAPAVAKGVAVVQIGAYLSEAQAADAWRRVSGLMGGESTGRGRHIEPVQANGATRYRSQFTGFASRADAVKFCATLKTKSQDCIVKSAN